MINTYDSNASGNVGMKDQVLAMKWVRDNIKFFGGSEEKVTLMGGSIGAAGVHSHLMSPMSKGLFSRAYIASGTAISPWAFTVDARNEAFALGDAVGVKTDNSEELMSGLKKVNTKTLVGTNLKMLSLEHQNVRWYIPRLIFVFDEMINKIICNDLSESKWTSSLFCIVS